MDAGFSTSGYSDALVILGAAGIVARGLDRNPACQTSLDFLVLSVASFKAARTLARDEVTSFLREPFVEGEGDSLEVLPAPGLGGGGDGVGA